MNQHIATRITLALRATLTPDAIEGQAILEAAVLTGTARQLAEDAIRSAYGKPVELAWLKPDLLGAYVSDHLGSVMDARVYVTGNNVMINVRNGGTTHLTLDQHVAEALAVVA